MGKLFRVSLLVFAGMFFLVSCEKEDALVKDDSFVQEEGLKSTTGDQEMPFEYGEADVVLHKHYDGSLTAEEADAKWNEDKTKIEITSNLKGYSTEWFYDVGLFTGEQYGNDTDGQVYVAVYFTSNLSASINSTGWNTIGNVYDFEGGWDYFLIRDYISNESVQWLELESALVGLVGTDNWYIKDYQVKLDPDDQTVSATGYSEIISEPEVFLYSSTSSGLDIYNTGQIGTGRLSF